MAETKKLCPVFKKCGGCKYIDIPYEEELKKKEAYVVGLLKPYIKLSGITGMKDPSHYRNKVSAAFGLDRRGVPVSGIYEEKSHHIVQVDSCLLEDKKADEIIVTIRSLLKSFKIKVYDEDSGYGLLRHVLIRVGKTSGQIMVVLVTASPIFPSKQNFCKALRERHPEITTIVQNINNRTDSLVLSDRENVLYGKGFIEDTLCGKTFRISARSFYQINPVQTEKLYTKAIEYAGLTGKETILDAYCGIGTIGIIASDHAARVISVELNKDATRDAITNTKKNNIKNLTVYTDDAGAFMEKLAADNAKIDTVFMDPPRQGSSEAFIKSLLLLKPKKVVYISCGPDTLARDLKLLTRGGYKCKKAECFDMFPKTDHVETVALLSKLSEAKHFVNVKVEMDEMDVTCAESKATYREIAEWVQENY
ncbi:MAG: 23S rRNA (uracil(1939)-C(5))-methyltransferase RlmD, partial [Lachnospiraceae bacterium]|nr:23S rRNA (uracil(1939)-C(5))-methyltransferase RlmD [Lachnospiraceae bacterium]